MDTFITINGYNLNLSEKEAYNLVIRVVKREILKQELSAFPRTAPTAQVNR
ncbi:hypothetical protein NIES4103_62330 [Nostoc sp. NIES-4103]|nr:hypothetical protein NIES4103_62330 [Nostoc sp. NIES-4103]